MYISCIESKCESAIGALGVVSDYQAHLHAYLWLLYRGVVNCRHYLSTSYRRRAAVLPNTRPSRYPPALRKRVMLSSLRAARALPRRRALPLALSSNSLCDPTSTMSTTKVYVQRRYVAASSTAAAASTSASAGPDKGSAPRLSGNPSVFLPD